MPAGAAGAHRGYCFIPAAGVHTDGHREYLIYIYGVGPGAFLGQRGYVNTAVYMAMDVAACYYVYAALGAALWVLDFPAGRKNTKAGKDGTESGGASA